ncbi:hypothetical protein GF406_01605 [candidate division KSB1 bacterium]|nr:hypothetical protein [candidate division KSB1 bacterium]
MYSRLLQHNNRVSFLQNKLLHNSHQASFLRKQESRAGENSYECYDRRLRQTLGIVLIKSLSIAIRPDDVSSFASAHSYGSLRSQG